MSALYGFVYRSRTGTVVAVAARGEVVAEYALPERAARTPLRRAAAIRQAVRYTAGWFKGAE